MHTSLNGGMAKLAVKREVFLVFLKWWWEKDLNLVLNEIRVGFQQRHADFAQGIDRVGLGNFPEPAQVPEGVLELAA